MRPCWKPGSSPLRSTPGRTRTCDDCLFVREVPSPLGHGGRDGCFGPIISPVRESNPSLLFDRQDGTPAPSQGKQQRPAGVEPAYPPWQSGAWTARPQAHRNTGSKGGRSRTLWVRVGAALLSQEYALGYRSCPGRARTCNHLVNNQPHHRCATGQAAQLGRAGVEPANQAS